MSGPLHPTVEDVPIPTLMRCTECSTRADIEQLKVIEHLLGGWVRAHCVKDGVITTWRPVTSLGEEKST